MRIQLRHLRAYADDLPGNRPRLTTAEQEREDRILACATAMLVRFGRAGLTFNSFATALRVSPHTLRRHFTDLDSLLAELLLRHLRALAAALGQAAADHPASPQAARRAAYVAATRTGFNAPTPAHILLIRERHALPPDLAEAIEALRLQLGETLAGPHAEAALALLDEPSLDAAQVEAMLSVLQPAGRKAFFFEKKKQKTLIPAVALRLDSGAGSWHRPAALHPNSPLDWPPPGHAPPGPA